MRFFVNSQRMKTLTRQSLVAAAMAVGVSGVALADNDCTVKTLRGSYVFAANGYNLVSCVWGRELTVVLLGDDVSRWRAN